MSESGWKAWFLATLFALAIAALVTERRAAAARDAESQAAMRLLAEFHLRELGAARTADEYLPALSALCERHPDLAPLRMYYRDVRRAALTNGQRNAPGPAE